MSSVVSAISAPSNSPLDLSPSTGRPALWRASFSLCHRELIRFVRQRTRIVGALVTPVMFWLFIGAGMGRSFRSDGAPGSGNFTEYFYTGALVMILLFTAIFSTISIIEDRREGFLQSVLVAPIPMLAVVLGKVLGGTLLATGQGILFLALAPLVGIHPGIAGYAVAVLMMLLISFALTALGFCIAWRMSSTQGFHVIMNLFLMPMWFLSGALFPAEGARGPMRWLMAANPLTYGVTGLRRALYWGRIPAGSATSLPVCFAITVASAAALMLIASLIARGRLPADLQ